MDRKTIPHAVVPYVQTASDYVRGVNSQIVPIVNIPSGDWSGFLPTAEPQRYKFDTNECTQLSGIHVVETQLNWLNKTGQLSAQALNFFTTNGYIDSTGSFALSERFTAIDSGTNENGGSPWWFWQTISKHGILPRADLHYTLAQSEAFSTEADMCRDYYNPSVISQAMRNKAIQSLEYIAFQYEWLGGSSFSSVTPLAMMKSALQQAPLHIGVPVCEDVWNLANPNLSVVPFCGKDTADHCIMMYRIEGNGNFDILDHYPLYFKSLSSGYFIPQVILGIVTPLGVTPPPPPPSLQTDAPNSSLTPQEASYFSLTLSWILGKIIGLLFKNNPMPGKQLGILASSEDPTQVAATVTGALIAGSSLIVYAAGHLGFIGVTPDVVAQNAGAFGTGIGAIWALFGLLRKIAIKLLAPKPTA
jgi:hypothetical protein